MKNPAMRANFLLLITAIIWGFAFVAQRTGMEYVGPLTFNFSRFFLGALSIIPLMIITRHHRKKIARDFPKAPVKELVKGGLIAGVLLFFGAFFQQTGVVYTTAGKAGFITGLYLIIVPIIGIFWNQNTSRGSWIGAGIAIFGLYLLSIKAGFRLGYGDFLVLISAFFWAFHVQVIGLFTSKVDSLQLAFLQFVTCGVLSLVGAIVFEDIIWQNIQSAGIPILYAGLVSVGIAYTIQVIAQQHAHPSHAAIIMSLETVFAVIGGWLFLAEILSTRAFIGCGLMLAGMLISQLWGSSSKSKKQI